MQDLDFIASLLADPDVMRFYPRCLGREEAEDWIERRVRAYASHGYSFWLVEDRATHEPIGQVGLLPQVVDGRPEAEIGYMIASRHWRRGFATEAAEAVRDYAVDRLGKTRLISLIRPENHPSQAVARRLGMRLERETLFRDLVHGVHVIEVTARSTDPASRA